MLAYRLKWRRILAAHRLGSPFPVATLPLFGRNKTRESHVSTNVLRNGLHKQAPKHIELRGQSGRHYLIKKVLQEKELTRLRVYLAVSDEQQFVLKEVFQNDFHYYRNMHKDLGSPYLRTLSDTIPEESLFVYKYFTDHLLRMAPQTNLPLDITKRILRDALRGIAALHERDIVHTDIKANNILINWRIEKEDPRKIVVDQVQLSDVEDAVHLHPGRSIIGKQLGNYMWRSPEAHARGPINKASDIFSFGVVCIYAMLKEAIFSMDESQLPEGVEPLSVILERQLSYFANAESLNGFLAYLGDENPWCNAFKTLWEGFNERNPRKPFSMCQDIDKDFRDLVCALMHFDPPKRITAETALKHSWFTR
ncbi:serine/threonine protein kinase [Coccidioides immitis RS]|uniref:Serine/threonine protein kinase n=1 Tax=Coccidioides immitis (strain RS) TaxID=246410 RepID=A0A0D8JTM6_COCIM|nr:serine/threonine protein kinase [Coccidioides immitis RS]KJF60499.1 serine/threonine protein kinase [Coccidioides immitis RS]